MATMETRNKKTKNQGVEAEEETEMSTSITMDQGQFATLMHSLQQSQAEIFARLIQDVRTSTPAPEVSMTSPAANFSKCTARFNGSSAEVDGFIDAIEVYKNCLQISDENAVKGLSMLLIDSAALWWQGIKTSTTAWSDAIQKLKSAFGEHRPPFRIYLELFSLRQNADTTDLFIAKTRALLSRLPQEDLREKVQLDMVYGLLDRRIKKRLDRNSITSFDQLLHRARAIEESLEDSAWDKTSTLTLPSASHQSVASGATSTSAPSDKKTTSNKRLSCSYCKKWGHEKSQCKKLINNNKSDNGKSDNNVNKNKPIQCYGCGTPNVIKSKCEKCQSNSQNAFYSVTTTSDNVNSKVRDSRHRVIMQNKCDSDELRSTAVSVPPAPPALAPQSTCDSAAAVAARCLATVRERDNVPRGRESPSSPSIVPAGTTGNPVYCNAGSHLKLYCDCVTELQNNNEHSNVIKNVCDNNNFNRDNKFYVSSTKTSSQHGQVIQSDDNDNVDISCYMNKDINVQCLDNVQNDCLRSCIPDGSVHKCLGLSSVNVNRNNELQNCKKHLASAQGRTKGGPIKGEPNNNRPLMQIGILGENGTALLDTGSRGCIAGHTLFRVLKEKGHPLQQCTRNIRLADGCTRLMEVLVAEVQVTLLHKIVPTEFIIFPDAQDNESVLGIDFINSAGLVINFKQRLWHFSDSGYQNYKLITETFSPRHSYSAMNVLRDDEGAGLEDRRKIYADRSRRVGEDFKVNDKVLLATHQLSDASKSKTAKFFPKRDGPYVVKKKLSPTTYLIASDGNPGEVLGKFHANQLTPFRGRTDECAQPLEPKKKRGRPRLQPISNDIDVRLDHDRGRNRDLEGEYVARQPHDVRVNVSVGPTDRHIQSDDRGNDGKVGTTDVGDQSRATIIPADRVEQTFLAVPEKRQSKPESTPETCTRRVSGRARKAPAILDL